MRCQQCNKFVSQEQADPEANDVSCNAGVIEGGITITIQCAECNSDLKQGELDLHEEVKDFCDDPSHEQNVDEITLEPTERGEGKGRYRKTFYGAEGTFEVSCSCGKKAEHKWSDAIQASHMDEA